MIKIQYRELNMVLNGKAKKVCGHCVKNAWVCILMKGYWNYLQLLSCSVVLSQWL